MLLVSILAACGPAVPVGPPLLGGIPAYPEARKLCEAARTLQHGQLQLVLYATPDDPAVVRAFYEANHGAAQLEPSGERLTLRASPGSFVLVGPKETSDTRCGTDPGPADRTTIVVSEFSPR